MPSPTYTQIKFEMKGLKQFEAKLRRLAGPEFKSLQHKATLAGALTLRDAIRESISTQGPPRSEPGGPPHVDKGNLLRALIVMRRRKDPSPSPYVAQYSVTIRNGKIVKRVKRRRETGRGPAGGYATAAGPGVYARFLEYGTSRMRARPFITPAVENNKDRILAAIKEQLKAAIHEILAQ